MRRTIVLVCTMVALVHTVAIVVWAQNVRKHDRNNVNAVGGTVAATAVGNVVQRMLTKSALPYGIVVSEVVHNNVHIQYAKNKNFIDQNMGVVQDAIVSHATKCKKTIAACMSDALCSKKKPMFETIVEAVRKRVGTSDGLLRIT
ncbi:MAG: hypothetical protein KGO83_05160 [Paenibacillaceae bacterium]|nr:hypothetical protein [Paenibacillaceae bacterium]